VNARHQRLVRSLAACTLALATASACGTNEPAAQREITVLAASSLTEVFTTLATEFEHDHPGVKVTLAFDSSATLAQQVIEGAPADVLATADLATMAEVVDAGAVDGEAATFATNTMVLVTPANNPAGLDSFHSIDQPTVTYVACVETAPCGKVATQLLKDAGIEQAPASLEPDVKAVLARVVANEADAGLVYATDAVAAGNDVIPIDIPGAADAVTTYPIASLSQATDAELARAFTALVTGSTGQELLATAGFGPPR
jgi:molybdate transport system substrate-binding protein